MLPDRGPATSIKRAIDFQLAEANCRVRDASRLLVRVLGEAEEQKPLPHGEIGCDRSGSRLDFNPASLLLCCLIEVADDHRQKFRREAVVLLASLSLSGPRPNRRADLRLRRGLGRS